jgi:hypothetical protein
VSKPRRATVRSGELDAVAGSKLDGAYQSTVLIVSVDAALADDELSPAGWSPDEHAVSATPAATANVVAAKNFLAMAAPVRRGGTKAPPGESDHEGAARINVYPIYSPMYPAEIDHVSRR